MIIRIIEAYDRLDEIRELFSEYAEWIGLPLDFQGFEEELASLPSHYDEPDGRMYLAEVDGRPAGCAALRPFDAASEGRRCEIKRLYVRDEFKGCGIGGMLARKIIEQARAEGYSEMLLDSFDFMESALAMYKKLGFQEIEPYRFNPHPNVRYMRLQLQHM